jgi:kinesin family protein 5
MYKYAISDRVKSVTKGATSTIFAYGNTGSGKTYSVLGPELVEQELLRTGQISKDTRKYLGIMGRALNHMFTEMSEIQEQTAAEFFLSANYYEIYQEKLYDLLS